MEGEPEVKQEETAPVNQEKTKKGEPREKRPRQERKNEHEYNADIIDENTIIPALPKKSEVLPKPDIKQFKEREKKSSSRIEDIINKKKQIRVEKFKFNRKAQDGDSKHDSLQCEFGEVQQLRDKLAELRVERNKLGDDLHDSIHRAKANNDNLKEYRAAFNGCRENFLDRLEELEHRQMTKELKKGEDKEINAEILLLKRKVKEAESSSNIELKLEQAEDLKDELDDIIEKIKTEKGPVDKEYTILKDELDKKNAHITGLKSEMTVEKNEKTEEKGRHDKEYESWKENKKVRLDKLEAEITKIKEENSKLWDQFHSKQDDYWKQKQLIDFLEWQNRIKKHKVYEKEKESRKAQYEQREKAREEEGKLKKYSGEIELINFLINYLTGLNNDSKKIEEEESKEIKINQAEITSKIAADANWKKEKGLEVIQSKKQKEEGEPEKKYKKKGKKKQEEKKEEKFSIPYSVQTMFETIKIATPTSLEEVEKSIKELKDLETLFERVAKEESTEDEIKIAEGIRQKEGKQKVKQSGKGNKSTNDDFPTI